ncbi:MAG: geranylgeranyl reductase family protein [Ilumatobacteraceae bacterium]
MSISYDKASNYDVLVVGAGPAGIAAALSLQSAGRKVVVVDKAQFPRDKCCGDGLTTGALRILEELGFDPSTVPSWRVSHDVWLRSPSGRELSMPLPNHCGQFAAIAPRLELDNALVEHARNIGVEVLDGLGFHLLTEHPEHLVAQIENHDPVQCNYLIAADGMWSPVRKSLGLTSAGYLGEWHAFRQYASNVSGPARDRLYVFFEPDLLPGYAWSFPLTEGRVNFGFGILRGGKYTVSDMKQIWPTLLARDHIRKALGEEAIFEDRHTSWPIPARITKATLGAGRVLFAGDAACVSDPLTGEGIGQALLSGQLAARAILEGGTQSPAKTQSVYRRSMGRHLFADHRMSATLGYVMRSQLCARSGLRLADMTLWTRKHFARWMFEDEPRAALFTPHRWHRNFLRRAGAYSNSQQN